MKIDLSDDEDWIKVGKAGPDRNTRPARFQTSKLFTTRTIKRGNGGRINVPERAPRFVLNMGHTQRAGIGADSRTLHRSHLRAQALYIQRDGEIGFSQSFDKDGKVESVWDQVESWVDDKRYFRMSLNPFDHEQIKDWQRFVWEFMDALQNGSHHTLDPDGKGLHWHADGLLTDEDRAAGNGIDWVGSIHRETGRTHAHVLMRGTLGKDDLYIANGMMKNLWQLGRGIASMDHHVGMQLDRSMSHDQQIGKKFEQQIQKEAQFDDRTVRHHLSRDMEIE